MSANFKVGQKVHYVGGIGEPENGIVKAPHPDNPRCIFVVYKCGNNWKDFRNYTSALTALEDLREGWVDQL